MISSYPLYLLNRHPQFNLHIVSLTWLRPSSDTGKERIITLQSSAKLKLWNSIQHWRLETQSNSGGSYLCMQTTQRWLCCWQSHCSWWTCLSIAFFVPTDSMESVACASQSLATCIFLRTWRFWWYHSWYSRRF